MNEELKKCRICGTPTEGWGLEGLHDVKSVQSWCATCCIEEFEEHDWFCEDGIRYCKRCSTDENPDDTAQYFSDLIDHCYND